MTELIDGLPWWWALPACILLSLLYVLDVLAARARARRRARAAELAEVDRISSRFAATGLIGDDDLAFLDRLRNARRSPVV